MQNQKPLASLQIGFYSSLLGVYFPTTDVLSDTQGNNVHLL